MKLSHIPRTAVFALVCSAVVLLQPARLLAHAVLVESTPKSGATVHGPDLALWLRFNVRVDGSRSRFTLVSADGNTKSMKPDTQSKPDILTAKVTGLAPGKYRLQWQVLAADGHISQGIVNFTVV
ncbi:MAG TPA: copper resistance CopC family protein [Terriglobales bacterium]|nr:copper resistance CopC family protein [Terriglobales bacterium]